MHAKLIYNPTAGRRAGSLAPRPSLDEVAALLSRYEIATDVAVTERVEHATDLASEAVRQGYETVLVAGGDGTIHEASQALVGTSVKLGILPMGSVMNLARALAIPRDAEAAVQILRMGHVIGLDVGQAGGSYFLEMAGVGFDAGIFQRLNEVGNGHLGSIPDLIRFIRAYEAVPFRVRIDNRLLSLQALMVLVANTPYYDGIGLQITPRARLNDGQLDVVVIGGIDKVTFLWHWLRSMLPGNVLLPATRHFRGREIRVEGPPGLPVHADAFSLDDAPVDIRIRPGALQVYVGFPPDPDTAAFVDHPRPRVRLPWGK